jgi:hypothetical protein
VVEIRAVWVAQPATYRDEPRLIGLVPRQLPVKAAAAPFVLVTCAHRRSGRACAARLPAVRFRGRDAGQLPRGGSGALEEMRERGRAGARPTASGSRTRPTTSPTGQLLGTGDDALTQFQLVKHYPSGSVIKVRTLTKPVAGTVEVYLDGVELSGWSIDTAAGLVSFTTAPALGARSRRTSSSTCRPSCRASTRPFCRSLPVALRPHCGETRLWIRAGAPALR